MSINLPQTTLSDAVTGRLSRVAETDNLTAALPNEAYLDAGFEEIERDFVLRRNWIAIGFEADLPEDGDMAPVDIAGLPLLMVRDRESRIRVFHNVCRHRGMRLVERPTRAGGGIQCPYHAWRYRLDGALDRTPHVGGVGVGTHEAVDRSALGLMAVNATVWCGVVFADLSGDAPDFEAVMAPIKERWREFDGVGFHSGGDDSTFSLELDCNWKLAVENYLESYHLPSVHPGLNSYSRIEDHLPVSGAGDSGGQGDSGGVGAFGGQVSMVYAPAVTKDGGFPKAPGLSDYWTTRAEYLALYPNLLLGIHGEHWYAAILIPQAPGRTLERMQIGYFSEEAARGAGFADSRAANRDRWKGVFLEDMEPLRRMQQGRHSPAFDGGVLTPVLESATRHFHAWAASRLLAA